MKKKYIFISISYLISLFTFAQIPDGYYDNAEGLEGTALKIALHDIIDDHNSIQYGDIYDILDQTDQKENGKVWDMYSDVPGGTPPYEYTFFEDECGNYSGEGSCYNKEHSWPKSWFGGKVYPMYSDLFHIVPTDGYVNGMRSNYPYGEVGTIIWESENGSKKGYNTFPGYTGIVFEPIDEYKGDFARGYFYMSTRYYNEDGGWPGSDAVDGAELKPWTISMLLEWHYNDPVSEKERDRCDAIYNIQSNRNPFIDHPSYVSLIWDPENEIHHIQLSDIIHIFPIQNNKKLRLELINNDTPSHFHLFLYSVSGQQITEEEMNSDTYNLSIGNIDKGCYILKISDLSSHINYHYKFIK